MHCLYVLDVSDVVLKGSRDQSAINADLNQVV